jgi:hypothetical protein
LGKSVIISLARTGYPEFFVVAHLKVTFWHFYPDVLYDLSPPA